MKRGARQRTTVWRPRWHIARATCALYSWPRFEGHPVVPDRHRWARYGDTFVRTPGGWRQSDLLYLVIGEYTGAEARLGELAGRAPWPGS
jgi:hypothetical protein